MADMWLQVKPGHDGLLAMSMIYEIIAEELYDKAFVREFSVGFDVLRKASYQFKPDTVAGKIWLSADEIREAARLYALSKSACIVDGNGLICTLRFFRPRALSVCSVRLREIWIKKGVT